MHFSKPINNHLAIEIGHDIMFEVGQQHLYEIVLIFDEELGSVFRPFDYALS